MSSFDADYIRLLGVTNTNHEGNTYTELTFGAIIADDATVPTQFDLQLVTLIPANTEKRQAELAQKIEQETSVTLVNKITNAYAADLVIARENAVAVYNQSLRQQIYEMLSKASNTQIDYRDAANTQLLENAVVMLGNCTRK